MSGERVLIVCTGCYSLLKWTELDEARRKILRDGGSVPEHCPRCGQTMAWQWFPARSDRASANSGQ